MKMRKTIVSFILCVGFSGGLQATSLTGEGYIYLTEPSTSWIPPSNVTGVARFMWYPDKSAFRFGDLSDDEEDYSSSWDDDNIGRYSFAGGYNAMASGWGAFAFGGDAFAVGSGSVAMGSGVWATGHGSVALGVASEASGAWGVAMGYFAMAQAASAISIGDNSLALGEGGVAIGQLSEALGSSSLALGAATVAGDYSFAVGLEYSTYVTGDNSIGMGAGASVAGDRSVAVGYQASAIADDAIAIGSDAYTNSMRSVALGSATSSVRMNGQPVSPTAEHADDPVFMVGHGKSSPVPAGNAFTIYRNGSGHFYGAFRVPPSGDIPMGSYTAKPSNVVFPQ